MLRIFCGVEGVDLMDSIEVELANQDWAMDKNLPANFYGLMRFHVKVD